MSQPVRKSRRTHLRQLASEALELVTGGALNPYLELKGQKTGTIKGDSDSAPPAQSAP